MRGMVVVLIIALGCGKPQSSAITQDLSEDGGLKLDGGMVVGTEPVANMPSSGMVRPMPTASSLLAQWLSNSDSIFEAHVTAFNAFAVDGPPFIKTKISLTNMESFRGTPIQTVTVDGGTLGDLQILVPHGPNIRVGESYVLFVAQSEVIAVARVLSADTVSINGAVVSLASIRGTTSAAPGGAP